MLPVKQEPAENTVIWSWASVDLRLPSLLCQTSSYHFLSLLLHRPTVCNWIMCAWSPPITWTDRTCLGWFQRGVSTRRAGGSDRAGERKSRREREGRRWEVGRYIMRGLVFCFPETEKTRRFWNVLTNTFISMKNISTLELNCELNERKTGWLLPFKQT